MFLITSPRFLLRIRNVSDKICGENQNTHFMFKIFSRKRSLYEITWKRSIQPDRPQMTIWRMRITCWIPKAKNIHSEYVILIDFPL
jgi:hypothetical protein